MKNFLTLLVLIVLVSSFSGKRFTPQDYIEKYKEDAITEMERSGVPASITLAQGMLESGYGNSELAKKANNHFGIKCHSDWTGATFRMDDDKKNECFRKYKSVWFSYRDHSNFLKGKKRYAFLFDLKITDYKGWCRGLRKAGYATNKKYAKLLIDLIERHDLNQYVKGGKKHKKSKKIEDKKKDVKETTEDHNFEVNYSTSKIKISDNWIKYLVIQKGDTYYSLSKKSGIPLNRILKYNECTIDTVLSIGERIYLQPKRRKAKTKKYIFKEGDSLYTISQRYGIKMKSIYKRNRWTPDYQPSVGEEILLRGRRKK